MEDGGEVRRGEAGGGNNAGGCLHRKVENWVCVCACECACCRCVGSANEVNVDKRGFN